MSKLVIDGDHVVFRAAASCNPTKDKPHLEPLELALERVDSMMSTIFEKTNASEYLFYIKGEGNWRTKIYPEYKANRKDNVEPPHLQDVREYVITNYNAKIVNDIEVDDICGIELTKDHGVTCVSLDKDLLQVPGMHYNFVKGEFYNISVPVGNANFYKQVVTGDAVDNVPAFDLKFRNKTPKFIEELLRPIDKMLTPEEMCEYVENIYMDWWGNPLSNHWYEIMERNAKVLWIQRKDGDEWQNPNIKAG